MNPVQSRQLFVAIVVASFLLAACSTQPAPSGIPAATLLVQPPGTNNPALPTEEVQPSLIASTPSKESDADDQVIRSYHTVLMLERAADLMLAFIVKTDTGEIPLGDAKARDPYLTAFPVAIDDFNKTTPPSGMLNHGWKTVSTVTAQYVIVYAALEQGNGISNNDLFNLKAFRQIMTNYQNLAEGYLTQRGQGTDFFSKQQEAVDQHFKQVYKDLPMPTLMESGGN